MSLIFAKKSSNPGTLFGFRDLKRNGNSSKILLPGTEIWLTKITPSENEKKFS